MDSFHELYSACRINLNIIHLLVKNLIVHEHYSLSEGVKLSARLYFGCLQSLCYKGELNISHRLK